MSADKVAGKKQTPANTRKLVPDWLRNIRTTGKPDKDHSDDTRFKVRSEISINFVVSNIMIIANLYMCKTQI